VVVFWFFSLHLFLKFKFKKSITWPGSYSILSVYSTMHISPISEYLWHGIRLSVLSSFCQCIFIVYKNAHFSYVIDLSLCVKKCIILVCHVYLAWFKISVSILLQANDSLCQDCQILADSIYHLTSTDIIELPIQYSIFDIWELTHIWNYDI